MAYKGSCIIIIVALKIHPCTETIETGEQNEENAAKLVYTIPY